ncbi:hypothetical protein AQUCO_05500134v1 [Aquilegia coerulea]|uniref:S-protein homolog n=1 Tax=Aquilegia coerulea TaxID=218851 RepID=A0A2G5CH35_AQUCA|nr:hypothetical protein AQUCO_05500134v1 [Aquilegia coerulea]
MGIVFSNGTFNCFKLALLLVFFVWSGNSYAVSEDSDPKTNLTIINYISESTILYLHCKSRDNDLGPQVMAYSQHVQWKFYPNIFDTTLFWCTMNWIDSDGHEEYGSFNIYESDRDRRICAVECQREVRKEGVYFNYPNNWRLMYTWSKRV